MDTATHIAIGVEPLQHLQLKIQQWLLRLVQQLQPLSLVH